jgi:hypothetical protein
MGSRSYLVILDHLLQGAKRNVGHGAEHVTGGLPEL